MGVTCSQFRCEDEASTSVHSQDGGEYPVCEDHKHMRIDGTPTEGYEPNDPEKFNDEPDEYLRAKAKEEFGE